MSAPSIPIAITDGRLFENYANWLNEGGNFELVRVGYQFNNLEALKRCAGLFLTGGEDVHPQWYGKGEFVNQFGLTDLDEKRDDFEIKLLEYWKKSGIPLLGVCRGQQLTNVFLGGTLIPHLPAYGKLNHARKTGKPRYHEIEIDTNSNLAEWIGDATGKVTSVHHQSVDRVADSLVTNALSPDGVIEGLEYLDATSTPPLILVQWHPEMMDNSMHPFSHNVRQQFIKLVEAQ